MSSNTLPKRVLVAITSYNGALYDDGKRTGLYWSEALHPYNVFVEAGFEVDVASEKGTMGYDEHSIEGDGLDPESKEAWEDVNNPLKKALKESLLKAADVDPSKYGIFFGAGGHGAIYDYPGASGLHAAGSAIYGAGGVIAAVCHGPAILPGIKDPATGQPAIKGKKVTGFTKVGEEQMGLLESMRKDKVHTIEELVTEVGAEYVQVGRDGEQHVRKGGILWLASLYGSSCGDGGCSDHSQGDLLLEFRFPRSDLLRIDTIP